MRGEWPALEFHLDGDALLEVDKRALQSMLRNLFHNAVVHGKADKIMLSIKAAKNNSIRLSILDNGKGFQGDVKMAANLFKRHYSGSGSGIGLFLVSKLAKLSGGQATPVQGERGFGMIIDLPGRKLS